MAAAFRTVEEFVPGTGAAWPLYLGRLEFYFIANDITDNAKKRAVLCTFCGAVTYAIIHSLCSPALPSQTGYENNGLRKYVSEVDGALQLQAIRHRAELPVWKMRPVPWGEHR